MKSTEIELRGPLSKEAAERLISFVKEKGVSGEQYTETAIFFNTDTHPAFGSYASGSARIQANQKLYSDGRICQVSKMKVGNPSGAEREEFEIPFASHGLKSFMAMLKRLGITEASFRSCQRHDYDLGNIVLTLKFSHPVGDHYEAEITEGTQEDLRTFLDELDLPIYEEDEFKEIVMASRNQAPYISIDQGIDECNIV
ncbi:MAG: hypothetical protein Q8P93_01240 [bacterium]|nr:hypothetical protein [bacterium]